MEGGSNQEPKKFVQWDAYKIQQNKLDKLMANIDKPVDIPERPKEKNFPEPPQFVRNVMGSSAGAGSGEFHVYRHLRRKEMARTKFMEEQARQEELDRKFQEKMDQMKRQAEERTAKKREKRLKKKQKFKKRKVGVKNEKSQNESSESESDTDDSDQANNKSQEISNDATSDQTTACIKQESNDALP